MQTNNYFTETTAGEKITCKKACTLKIFATVNGDPNVTSAKLYIYQNETQISSISGGSGRSIYIEVNASVGDYFTWKRSSCSVGACSICFCI